MDEHLLLRMDVMREALNLVVDELERAHGESMRIDTDYFWSVPSPERTNVYQQPSELTIGQLSDLVEGMHSLVEDPERVTVVDAIKLAELLRTAGEALQS